MSIKFVLGCVVIGLLAPLTVRADDQKPTDSQKSSVTSSEEKIVKTEDKMKGRLPQYYSKVGVTPDQRQKIYGIQATYAPKIEALEKQIQDLKAQLDVEARGVLSADQQKKLDEYIAEHKGKKASDVKADVPVTMDGNNKVTESVSK